LETSLQHKEMVEPRTYRSEADLVKMCALLRAGSAAANGTHYAHIGDLYWSLYYAFDGELWKYLSLWDDPCNPDRLLAWSLTDPGWAAFDVYVQPELRDTPLAEAIYTWEEAHTAAIVRAAVQDTVRANYIADNDDVLNVRLHARGFQRVGDGTVCMSQSLDAPLPQPGLPDGYTVRGCRGEAVMAEALRRLKDRGMERASVCTTVANTPGIRLYEAVGFQVSNRFGLYEKKLA
jgi:GNAT superfamily N-acetyltransferase